MYKDITSKLTSKREARHNKLQAVSGSQVEEAKYFRAATEEEVGWLQGLLDESEAEFSQLKVDSDGVVLRFERLKSTSAEL